MLLNKHTHWLHCVSCGCLFPSEMAVSGQHGWLAMRERLQRPSGSTVCSTVAGLLPRRHLPQHSMNNGSSPISAQSPIG